ncbi:ATP phosphoribosyltransferase regulatory subunit, partial [Algiphilus sp.]
MSAQRAAFLPDGVEELLPDAAWMAEDLRRRLLDHYRERGYGLILPPLVEHLDSLLVGAGEDLEEQTFRFVDPASGRMLGVRADMTPQAARIAATRFPADQAVRLCYLGSVLRTHPDT